MRRAALFAAIAWWFAALTWGELSVTAYAQEVTDKTPQSYKDAVKVFMTGRGADINEQITTKVNVALKDRSQLTRDQITALTQMRKAARTFRPQWWPSTRSKVNISFKAEMWRKRFGANYVPSDQVGVQAPIGVDPRTQRLVVVVSWRPALIDSAKPLDGWLAKVHGMTQADLAEVIVWHELGHNYVTLNLRLKDAFELYTQHLSLFHHVQEFYADLTALRHCSPRAARTTLMFRMRELSSYDGRAPHTRAAHGLASLMLSEWLEHPRKWPMVHFPPEVPEKHVELETIKYVYEHLSTRWTPREYFALQAFIDRWVRVNGDRVLKGKGQIRLPNRQEMRLMVGDDREHQSRRDQWVAMKLKKIIEDGRADAKPKGTPPNGNFTTITKADGTQLHVHTGGRWNGIVIP